MAPCFFSFFSPAVPAVNWSVRSWFKRKFSYFCSAVSTLPISFYHFPRSKISSWAIVKFFESHINYELLPVRKFHWNEMNVISFCYFLTGFTNFICEHRKLIVYIRETKKRPFLLTLPPSSFRVCTKGESVRAAPDLSLKGSGT